jgi:lipopolysaccharide export system ATP-binding protein
MLSAVGLQKSFGGVRVVEDVSLSLRRGEIVGLLGPNGAGKTTIFRLLTATVVPDSGRIMLDGVDLTQAPFYQRAQHGICYLPQDSFVPGSLSVEDSLLTVLENRNVPRRQRHDVLDTLLSDFNLTGIRTRRVSLLSGGQRRRCEIAVSLACNPRYALLDEPFAGVDPNAVEEIASLIQQLRARKVGVLITDHNARALLGLADRAYVLKDGYLLAEGRSSDIAADRRVQQFYLGGAFQIH